MVRLQELPAETLFSIFRELMPRDLGRLCRSCREFHDMIHTNYLLYREVYLQRWDRPLNRPYSVGEHWKRDLERYTKMLNILESDSIDTKKSETFFVATAIDAFLAAASPTRHGGSLNVAVLVEQFEYKLNRVAFLYRSSTFDRARTYRPHRPPRPVTETPPIGQLSAKLNCLHGAPSDRTYSLEGVRVYPFAAARVYDLRNYTQANIWGPFKDDGSLEVDWEKVEAVMLVLGHNIERKRALIPSINWDGWTKPFHGAFAHSYEQQLSYLTNDHVLQKAKKVHLPTQMSTSEDPYGVSGYWMRIVCFVDYHELFAFNFNLENPPPGEPLEPLDTEEATRILVMAIEVTEIARPGPEDGQDLPVVHFRGVARPMLDLWDANAHNELRGSVRQTKEGEIRWTTFSVYEGEERWRSEGIQLGGLRSGRGVYGHWFDKNYDPQGPAGPSAFWKIHDMSKTSKAVGGESSAR